MDARGGRRDVASIFVFLGRYSGLMSQRRARKERKDLEPSGRARSLIVSAEKMLAVDFSDVPSSRTRQVIVGWMRHAFEQSRVIAQLHVAGIEHAAAPNWRSYVETAVRLQWLESVDIEDRAGAVDAMIDHDKERVVGEVKSLRALGHESEAHVEEMDSLILEVTQNGDIKNEARKLFPAIQASRLPSAGLFRAWRQETQYSHATAILGGAYAPSKDDRLGFGTPPLADPDLELHGMVQILVVMSAAALLEDEGVARSKTSELFEAYFT